MPDYSTFSESVLPHILNPTSTKGQCFPYAGFLLKQMNLGLTLCLLKHLYLCAKCYLDSYTINLAQGNWDKLILPWTYFIHINTQLCLFFTIIFSLFNINLILKKNKLFVFSYNILYNITSEWVPISYATFFSAVNSHSDTNAPYYNLPNHGIRIICNLWEGQLHNKLAQQLKKADTNFNYLTETKLGSAIGNRPSLC